ncbi:VOC family protein [Pilimelia columellifera]|uniref:VOC family protein n=1 Tax=Pilimelia columellifera subsp. columellifera TaxID=706583 RepID=A0ABN3NKR5_9ACTN
MTSTFKTGVPCWLDLGATDVDAAVGFYSSLFGWQAEDMGPESGHYRLLRKDGKQVAGLGQATDAARGSSWAIYLKTDDVDATLNLIGKHGGTTVVGATDVMDLGRMAVCQDPAGAYFSLWQPAAHPGVELVAKPGSLVWTEVYSTDREAVTPFYEEVFGLRHTDSELPGGMVYRVFTQGEDGVIGCMQITPDMGGMPSAWVPYFEVEDVDVVGDAAIAAGATELMRDTVPAGRIAWLVDPQGATFCIMKPDPTFAM